MVLCVNPRLVLAAMDGLLRSSRSLGRIDHTKKRPPDALALRAEFRRWLSRSGSVASVSQLRRPHCFAVIITYLTELVDVLQVHIMDRSSLPNR